MMAIKWCAKIHNHYRSLIGSLILFLSLRYLIKVAIGLRVVFCVRQLKEYDFFVCVLLLAVSIN